MQLPIQLTFRDMDSSPALTEYVHKRAAKLDTFFDRITSCRVALEAPQHRKAHGKQFRARVDITVPGAELVAGDHPANDATHEDMYAAIDDAFSDVQRQLRDYADRQRERVKTHSHRPPAVRE